ncbi:FAD-binding protein [Ligilactobacillus equi]|uniref:FMN-binding domain-containing protein n=1 Tax=Ligilactobacillus equi DPC 6820 TaxID=1392007 RepID=V7HSS3_9LACO|nr:FAD-binding protein [Ligilactobacillus equi]ETA73274.1 FMN-binding domain-containing protein [Ligilactobacillus equi DPC 6820]
MEKVQYDVLVIGASNAGGMAAATAAEKGAKVLVIDKSRNTNFLHRETIASIHSKVQKEAKVEIDKNELVNYLSTFAQGNVDERLLNTWTDYFSETVDWIDEKVLRPHGAYMQATADAYYETERNRAFPTGNEVTAEHVQHWHMGYGANQALVQKWNPWGLKTNVYNDSHRDDGSGILAALEIGAAKDEEPVSIVFNRGAVPVETNTKDFYETSVTPPDYPGYLWLASYPMLKVNLEGERFFNESAPYQFQMNAVAKQPGYLSAMIWTEATMTDKSLGQYHTLGCSRLGFPGIFNGDQVREGVQQRLEEGLVQKADTIEELAQKLGLPVANLQASVARYNEMIAS